MVNTSVDPPQIAQTETSPMTDWPAFYEDLSPLANVGRPFRYGETLKRVPGPGPTSVSCTIGENGLFVCKGADGKWYQVNTMAAGEYPQCFIPGALANLGWAFGIGIVGGAAFQASGSSFMRGLSEAGLTPTNPISATMAAGLFFGQPYYATYTGC